MKSALTSAPTTITSFFAKLPININNTANTLNKLENSFNSSKSNRDINDHEYWFIIKVRNKENPNEIIYTTKTCKKFQDFIA